MSRPNLNMWSKNFPNCIKCSTTQRKHKGNGLCRRCYSRQMNARPEQKTKAIVRAKQHYEKKKGTPRYEAWARKRSHRLLFLHRVQRIAKRAFFGTGRHLSREQGALYICPICPGRKHTYRIPKDDTLFPFFIVEMKKLHKRFPTFTPWKISQ